jgi:hypothetical protein
VPITVVTFTSGISRGSSGSFPSSSGEVMRPCLAPVCGSPAAATCRPAAKAQHALVGLPCRADRGDGLQLPFGRSITGLMLSRPQRAPPRARRAANTPWYPGRRTRAGAAAWTRSPARRRQSTLGGFRSRQHLETEPQRNRQAVDHADRTAELPGRLLSGPDRRGQ